MRHLDQIRPDLDSFWVVASWPEGHQQMEFEAFDDAKQEFKRLLLHDGRCYKATLRHCGAVMDKFGPAPGFEDEALERAKNAEGGHPIPASID